MNLSDIRDRVFSQVDWSPTQSGDATTRVNRLINRAYMQLAEEAPFLFFEQTLRIATLPDFKAQELVPAVGGPDVLRVSSSDPWVLERVPLNTATGLTLWDQAGYWNSRMIEVTDGAGRVHRHRIRDIWTDDSGPRQNISLYQPWHNLTDGGMTYRIYTENYSLPDDLMQVYSLRLAKSNQNWPLDIVDQMEAEKLSLADSPSQVSAGVPRVAWRRGHFALDAPTVAPTAAVTTGANWEGPEPAGQFSYLMTYCWGYRDDEIETFGPAGSMVTSTTAHPEPRWESAPSPISGTVTNTNTGTNQRIQLTLPNLGFMQGFGVASTQRYTHGGFFKRIYRRRHAIDSSVVYTNLLRDMLGGNQIQTPEAYYLLGEVDDFTLTYDDNGNASPDYHRRLRTTHGYQSLAFYPRPDQRYEVDIRCIRRPEALINDQDTPRIHLDAMETLITKTLILLYEMIGNVGMADRALGQYRESLFTMTKRYGDLSYPSEPMLRKPARVSQRVDSRKPWRRWYNLP